MSSVDKNGITPGVGWHIHGNCIIIDPYDIDVVLNHPPFKLPSHQPRYTLGDVANPKAAIHPRTMYNIMDYGSHTGAYGTRSVIDHIYDDCEITGGEFFRGQFYSGTFTGGKYVMGNFYGGEFHIDGFTTVVSHYKSESGDYCTCSGHRSSIMEFSLQVNDV